MPNIIWETGLRIRKLEIFYLFINLFIPWACVLEISFYRDISSLTYIYIFNKTTLKFCIKCDVDFYIGLNIIEHIENKHETLPSIMEHKIFSHNRILFEFPY